MIKLIIFFFISLFSFPAYAYFDLGITSLIFQSIVGGCAFTIGLVSFFWRKIKSFFFKLYRNYKNKRNTKNIINN